MKTSSNNQSNNNSGKSNQKSTKSGSNANRKGKQFFPTWMTKYPGAAFANSNQYRVHDGKKYYWCKKHKRFTLHKTEECRKPSGPSQHNNQTSNTNSSKANNSNSNSAPSLRVSTATMMDE